MVKILANDGLHPAGIEKLRNAGFQVDTERISQEDLPERLQEYQVICVRSATKVREDLIDKCPDLKIIARGGVGLDNIDVAYARSKDIQVYNTPAASSRSVAELAIAHMLLLSRDLHLANRNMPSSGATEFKNLKKQYSKNGKEVGGQTLGIIGFGRIGQETARLALGLGMNVVPTDTYVKRATIDINIPQAEDKVTVHLETVDMDTMLAKSDYISLHIPAADKPILGVEEMAKMKDGVILINASRGGTVDEDALLDALNTGKIAAAGLDVFVGEPNPRQDLLDHDRISLSPHTGASTADAQRNIGVELADKIIAYFGQS